MLFSNRTLRLHTAGIALAAMSWMGFGGQAWAEAEVVEHDPGRQLARLADDGRLRMSGAEREYVRRAAQRMSGEPAPLRPAQVAPAHSELAAATAMQELAAELEQLAGAAKSAPADPAAANLAQGVASIENRLRALDREILAGFTATASLLESARLPAEIFARHEAAVADYDRVMKGLLSELAAVPDEPEPTRRSARLATVAEQLRQSSGDRPVRAYDPSRLPFRAATPVTRPPAAPADPSQTDPSKAGLALRAAPPGPADLAATIDVQITQEIRDLAASLGNRPTAIYEWVRNNVRFVPIHGSVQGSAMTLTARRGNAFDTASLLIALLRAAGVPARYVTGTVEVPIAVAQNWVGGAETGRVAQQLFGQGGVPTIGLLATDGSLAALRLEHVWVEAFVDNLPGRGVGSGPGDTWVPLDASFKQHTIRPRSSFYADNPLPDPLDPAFPLFTVDEASGRVTNVNDDSYDTRLEAWVNTADAYLISRGIEGTIDGLLGGATIAPEASAILPASLPYRVLQRGTAVAALTAAQRHAVRLVGYASSFDRSLGDEAFSVRLSLPELNSRRLGLQFDAATAADQAVLDAARNGGATSLPVYLVRVVPRIKLDGATLATGPAVGMGRNYLLDVILEAPEGPTTIDYEVVAGDEIVIGVTGNGVTKEVVEKRFAANPVDNAPEYLHQVQLHYWTECDLTGEITARALDVKALRLPSVGLFSSPLTVSYFFGTPRTGIYQSRIMDVQQSLVGAAGADPAKIVAFVKQSGVQGSYLEGAVFDQLENDPGRPLSGISSIHLLETSMRQGIPLYRITPANASLAIPQLNLSAAVERDIATAVAQGQTVLAAEREITVGPWRGTGYILQDEVTGGAAYLISGGLAGGGLLDCVWDLVPVFLLVLLILILIILLILLLLALAGALAPVLAGAGATAAAVVALFLVMLRGLTPLGGGSA